MDESSEFLSKCLSKIESYRSSHPQPFGTIIADSLQTMLDKQPQSIALLDICANTDSLQPNCENASVVLYGFKSLYTPVEQREEFASLIFYRDKEPATDVRKYPTPSVVDGMQAYVKTLYNDIPHPMAWIIALMGSHLYSHGWRPLKVQTVKHTVLTKSADSKYFIINQPTDNEVLFVEFYNNNHSLKIAQLYLNYQPLLLDQVRSLIMRISKSK